MGYGQIIIIPKPEFGGFERVFPFSIKIILPKANIAPEKSTPGRGDSYWNPSFSGAFEILLFVSGRGQITHLWGFFPTGPGFFWVATGPTNCITSQLLWIRITGSGNHGRHIRRTHLQTPRAFNGATKKAKHMGVSKNRGTPKSSILIGFSIINHPF